jgi:hypothetical protein
MSPELDEKLVKDFPELFRDRYAPMHTTAMCWGFSCGDGWEPLIRKLCQYLTGDLRRAKYRVEYIQTVRSKDPSEVLDWEKDYLEQKALDEANAKLAEEIEKCPVVVQVKEKFGTLRFYVDGASREQDRYISFAEGLSSTICEECGSMHAETYTMGWHRTLCREHAIQNYGEVDVKEYETTDQDS